MIRSYVGYVLTAALSGFTMMAYIANSSYVLQEQKGLQPMPFALFFASTALAQVLLSVLNAKIVGRFRPRRLIGFGLTLADASRSLSWRWGCSCSGTPLLLDLCRVPAADGGPGVHLRQCQRAGRRSGRHVAGAASAGLGVALAAAMAVSAPLASSGGSVTAAPMIWVMIAGITGSLLAYLVLPGHRPAGLHRT